MYAVRRKSYPPPYILYNIFIKKSNKIAKKRPICRDFLEKRTSFLLAIFLFHRWAPGPNRDDKKWKGISPDFRVCGWRKAKCGPSKKFDTRKVVGRRDIRERDFGR